MFWFSKKVLLSELLPGTTDIHTHLLPGVDDGADSVETSLALLGSMSRAGMKTVCCTPHVMAGHTLARTEHLKEVFASLVSQANGIELKLGAEYMLDDGFDEHLHKAPLSVDGKHLLVEMSYLAISNQLDSSIYDIQLANYVPVLAHPERYPYMTPKELKRLHERGVKFQLNLPSVGGYYGRAVQERAVEILANEWYHFVGTDLHHHRGWNALKKISIRESLAQQLEPLFAGNENLTAET